MTEAKQSAEIIVPEMIGAYRETFGDYNTRMKRVAESLDKMSSYLLETAEYCGVTTTESNLASKCVKDFTVATDPQGVLSY